MNLEQRIEKLEDRAGITGEIPPWIRIDVADQSKNSTDVGTPKIGIIPGQIGSHGFTLIRAEDETPDSFLKRCEKKHAEF